MERGRNALQGFGGEIERNRTPGKKKNLNVDGRILLNCIVEKYDEWRGMASSGSKKGTYGGLL
jgi:hypothetical protein